MAVADWGVHVFAFWRKDSFWRKEVAPGKHNAFAHHGHGVEKTEISGPSQPVRQRSVEEDAIARAINEYGDRQRTEGADVDADGEKIKSRLPPPTMELPTTASGGMPSPILQNPSTFGSAPSGSAQKAEEKPEMPNLQRTVSPRRFAILRAVDKEMSNERMEAQTEAQQGWERGEQREQKRLREMLQSSGAALKEKATPKSQKSGAAESNVESGDGAEGRQEGSNAERAEVEQDAQSTHSSQRRTLRFV